ncbi:MAG: hypothetical protein KDA66_10475, partial [Planctomycetaceae bacterium]|nr:hypothetical protein [Planctomycetaceae bacterium]
MRETRADFDELKEFVRGYGIAPSVTDDSFVDNLRIGHKRLFGFLTFVGEIASTNCSTNKFSD